MAEPSRELMLKVVLNAPPDCEKVSALPVVRFLEPLRYATPLAVPPDRLKFPPTTVLAPLKVLMPAMVWSPVNPTLPFSSLFRATTKSSTSSIV